MNSLTKAIRVCWIYHVTGIWVYPLLDYLGSGSKIIFFATVTAILNSIYLLGEVLNNCIWDTQKCKYCPVLRNSLKSELIHKLLAVL
ncbi:hypothetical protein lerEdw1_018132 [Lerista edwardsae]|nr:hypothetical protein lerEdw1_018132 [Lerista edwardsae]